MISTTPVRNANGTAHLKTLLKLLLLLVDYAEAEVDFVCLLKVRLHSHDLRESLFRVLK